MAQKLLCVVVLLLALMCVLASCGHEHVFGEWKTTKEATCIAEGIETRTCECGESETRPLSAKGHTDGEWITDKEANCTEDGSKHQICSVCEATIKTEIITKLGHTDGEWITDKEANCTEDGSKRQICSVCEATIKIETLTKLGHTYGEWITDKEANCTEDGSKRQICSVCETTIETETLTKLGHTYGEWITDKEANCTEDGSKRQICSVCETTIKTETLTKLGHTDGEWITDKEANCTEDGSKHQVCSVCNDTINTAVIPANGHNFGNWYVAQEATCAIDGIQERICTCNAKDTKTYKTVGHSSEHVSATQNGNLYIDTRYCPTCNVNFERNFDPITVSCEISKISVSSIAQITFDIDIDGGIGDYSYDVRLYEQPYEGATSYPFTASWANQTSGKLNVLKSNTDNQLYLGLILLITVRDSVGSVTYHIEFDNYVNTAPTYTGVQEIYTLN